MTRRDKITIRRSLDHYSKRLNELSCQARERGDNDAAVNLIKIANQADRIRCALELNNAE